MNLPYPSIAIAGSAKAHPDSEKINALARELGIALAKENVMMVLGIEHNPDHLPEIAYEAFEAAGGTALGIYRSRKEILTCSYRNVVRTVTAMERGAGWEPVIVLSAHVLVAIGGRAGTMQEITIAIQAGIPVVVIAGTGGSADVLAETDFLGFKRGSVIHVAQSASEAASLAVQLGKKAMKR